ncbi:MAG: helix-turn-helix domain-containing protein [Acidimicrobiales bacterium]
MAEHLADIGNRLRAERERHAISQRELARRIGLSASLISQIENGQSKPSVGTLYAIVTELGVSLDQLLSSDNGAGGAAVGGEAATRSGSSRPASPVVHPTDREVIDLDSGVRWERLTSHPSDGIDFLHVIYEVGGASTADGSMMRHHGKEYGFVISGRLAVQVGFDKHVLDPGDSIAFDSTIPHRLWNVGDEPVHGVWFVVGRQG